ncbi:MAG: isoaspartyl peptidase/L-asparaginase [Ponticaulis sp.]|nr:isoaspartyl peptidase/L-asparaginase [Ponticaulis sp.]|tara:strand:- start:9281 stop:10153 length:873 start_codon:yes stop_codon:yes gene_type:complete
MSDPVWAIAIHGGAGPAHKSDYSDETKHMRNVIEDAKQALIAGESAINVIQTAVRSLEESGHHIAGRGSSPNKDGKWELDAAIMDGVTREAGAVGALRGFKSPIDCARTVLAESPHLFLVGKGATRFLKKRKLERVQNPSRYYKPAIDLPIETGALQHGTVGAVALDSDGRLAAATSTGGLLNKQPGRIGDTPLIGAGTWADERVAVSCTGQGEYFIRCAAAADLSARIRYKKSDLTDAAACVLEDISYLGGQGGLIAIDRLGRVTMPFNTISMKRAFATWRGDLEVKVF